MSSPSIDFRRRQACACVELQGGALLLLAASEIDFSWRQDSFLYYLCGFNEPQSALLLLSNRPVGEQIHLFLRERDREEEQISGSRFGFKEALAILPVDAVHSITKLWALLPTLLDTSTSVYFHLGESESHDRSLIQALTRHQQSRVGRRNLHAMLPVHDSQYLAGILRSRKDDAEIYRLRAAASLTAQAFAEVRAMIRPGINERELHAAILHKFYASGGVEAFPSIVGGGVNSSVLHYQANNQILKDGEVVVVDAGALLDHYSADVTRTLPVGRGFNEAQRAVYQLVVTAQKAAIELAVTGADLVLLHERTLNCLVEGMIGMGWFKASKEEILERRLYEPYFPHATSHWLGMEFQDVGRLYQDGKPVRLEANMCFTIEPGLYVCPDDERIPEPFRGWGVRIEDDLIITADGAPEVLTASIPK